MRMSRKLAVSVLGLLSAGFITAFPLLSSAGTLPKGLTAGGLDLSGMTKEESAQKIEEYVNKMAEQSVVLEVDGNEIHTTAAELGYYWENREEIDAAQDLYAGGNLLERYLNLKKLEQEPLELKIQTAVNAETLAAFAAERCADYVKPVQDAEITRENGTFVVRDSVPGLELDLEATKKALEEAAASGLSEPITVTASVKEKKPFRTKEALSAIHDELGTFSTTFSTGNVSRSKNLKNGAEKVNGWVLMPGEEFSAYECMAPFTVENGYASAGSYSNGQVIDTIGGGACQLCTTLYNAALRAEMEITQRQNHSMSVGYVKPSEDAAIAGTVKDLKFKNSGETPIYIEGLVQGGTLTFTIYGKETRPKNRTIQFVSETLGTIDPGEPSVRVDPSLAPGQQVRVQSGHVGKRSRLWKYVYLDGVEQEKEILHTDYYMPSKAVLRVGPEVPAAAPAEPVLPDVLPEEPPKEPSGPAEEGPASQMTEQTPPPEVSADLTQGLPEPAM